MKRVFYIAKFHKEGNGYWVSFPDFPECFTQGENLSDAFTYAKEALELCIEDRFKNNEELPEPTLVSDSKEQNTDNVLLEYNIKAA